jgi:hypothetical protein
MLKCPTPTVQRGMGHVSSHHEALHIRSSCCHSPRDLESHRLRPRELVWPSRLHRNRIRASRVNAGVADLHARNAAACVPSTSSSTSSAQRRDGNRYGDLGHPPAGWVTCSAGRAARRHGWPGVSSRLAILSGIVSVSRLDARVCRWPARSGYGVSSHAYSERSPGARRPNRLGMQRSRIGPECIEQAAELAIAPDAAQRRWSSGFHNDRAAPVNRIVRPPH